MDNGSGESRKTMGFKQSLIDVAADTLSHNMFEADHRIANNLAMLSSYVRLKGDVSFSRTGRRVLMMSGGWSG